MKFLGHSMQKKRTVRSWGVRRIDQAFTGALKMRGYDRHGRRLVDPSTRTTKSPNLDGQQLHFTGEYAPEALVGTVDVHILPDIVETSFAEVQRQAGEVVDRILKTCGRRPRYEFRR